MTDVHFYYNVPDRLFAACRLAERAYRAGKRAVVVGPEPLLRDLDLRLWAQPPTGFLPHVAAQSPLAAETPVVLASQLPANLQADILIQLGDDIPTGVERFRFVMEVVGQDEAGRQAARARWRRFREQGFTLQAKDYGAGG